MKRILLTNKYEGIPLEIVKSEVPNGFQIVFVDDLTQDALETIVPHADYILAGGRLRITKTVLEKASKLHMIQRSGVGLDSLDLDAIKEMGIPLYVNQGVNSQSVAEHSLLLILASLRRLTEIDSNTKLGIWNKQGQGIKTAELAEKTVGIIGMGNTAKTLVSLLRPFSVRILYYDVSRQNEKYEHDNNMQYASLDELFKCSDIISLNCALTDSTRHIINAVSINKMKTGVVLVNTARGGVVDANALYDGLASGKISFAGIDVHETEPIPNEYALSKLNNVILTPHIAGVTSDSFRKMMHSAFRNIDLFDKGMLEEIKQYRFI
ncbi:D-3-phosphoglycerate dehydrogenase [Ruminococcaceae bacterium R-25]|nr:D-3-phosphoglycerate dehydrogenase [Ruminococcaceae bacterium R-25]SUQ11326.1 D-3-phosphoglycerate dehydrogenase [Oscillospiraceae bacterium]